MTWQTIDNPPPSGSRIKAHREDCPGYDTTGEYRDGAWRLASWFLRSDMRLIMVPTHWAPADEPQP